MDVRHLNVYRRCEAGVDRFANMVSNFFLFKGKSMVRAKIPKRLLDLNAAARYKRLEVEISEEWQEWKDKIPFLTFDQDWEVKSIPPFLGVMVRYKIRLKDCPDKIVSVALDCYNAIGGVPTEPYWEVYPVIFGKDAFERILLNDTTELIDTIRKALRS